MTFLPDGSSYAMTIVAVPVETDESAFNSDSDWEESGHAPIMKS